MFVESLLLQLFSGHYIFKISFMHLPVPVWKSSPCLLVDLMSRPSVRDQMRYWDTAHGLYIRLINATAARGDWMRGGVEQSVHNSQHLQRLVFPAFEQWHNHADTSNIDVCSIKERSRWCRLVPTPLLIPITYYDENNDNEHSTKCVFVIKGWVIEHWTVQSTP